MSLTLVLGPANSAKAGEVLGAYTAAARRGALLVVPTRLDSEHYVRELAAEGTVLGSVLTFSGLAGEIARRTGYEGRRLSPLQRDQVLARVLARARLGPLSASAAAPGFRASAGELIAELQRELVAPRRLTTALGRWAEADPRRRLYGQDLSGIYGDYVAELDRLGRVDSELYAWRALDALRAEPGRWGRDAVFFYGFDDLTALERDAVETLARVVGVEVTVSLTYEPGRPALAARAEAAEELRPLAERVLELPARDEHYAPGSRAVLHHLERHLFQPAEPIEAAGVVRLLEAGGERAEAELVAAEVLSLLGAGVAAPEIVVIHRHMGSVAPLYVGVLDRYGVPTASRYELSLAQTALGRSLLALARCARDGAERASADDLLDYLRAPGLLERPELADRLEAAIRRRGMTRAGQARAQLGWELDEIEALGGAERPGGELARQARRLFALPHRGRAPRLAPAEELDARALTAVLSALAELEELGHRHTLAELTDVLEELRVPAGRAEAGAVLLAEPLEVRARRFRAVLVCGLQEGEFPAAAVPEPFLDDERRWEIARCSGLRLRMHEDVLGRERYLLYASLSRATERVVLAYRSSDEEGNLALASPFVDDVAELFTQSLLDGRRRRLLADVVWPAEEAPTERERARSRAAAAAVPAGEPALPERVLGPGALSHVRHSRVLSAGALEKYASCPVRWLVEGELQPRALRPDDDPIVRGQLMHQTLEGLIGRLGGPVTEGSLQRAGEILAQLLGELPESDVARLAPGRSATERAAALRSIEADLRRYLVHEARCDPPMATAGLELRFGFEDEDEAGIPSLPPLELERDGERVLVRGMVDRVDVDGSGHAVVRDYKSGSPRPSYPAARWNVDGQLQVALYMLVVRELLGLDPVAGFYQPLRGDTLRARGIFTKGIDVGGDLVSHDGRTPEEVEAELDAAAERAVALAVELRAGRLTPAPSTCSRNGCAYPGICRSQ